MERGLFAKHLHTILTRNAVKEDLIRSLLEKTGITLLESEITLSQKKVTISTSSVKKTALLQKGCADILSRLGYFLQR
jgi:hypothetical protein